MTTEAPIDYQKYLNSPAWQALRDEVHARAQGRCEGCGAEAKETHHTNYPDNFNNDTAENLQALCRICHRAAHIEKRARELSKQIAAETDPERIFVLLLAWGVEFLKYSRG